MDRVTFEDSLQQANARVAAGQRALLEQRAQVRELEQCGLDASLTRALLRVYEQFQAASLYDQQRLYTLATATPDELLPIPGNDCDFLDADGMAYHRKAA